MKKENNLTRAVLQLEGRNAVLEALENNKELDKMFLKTGEIKGTLKIIKAKALEKGILIQEISKDKLDKISEGRNHQGVIAICPAYHYYDVDDILKKAKENNEDPFIIILDEITDPHNLGAIIRTAEACRVHGIIIPKRRAVGLTGTVSKTSAGGIEHVLVSKVNNIANTIDYLKKQNIWVACADMKGTNIYKSDLSGPLALVLGNEGAGVGKLISSKCDFSVKIPMLGNIQSLNVSVATGIFMYEVIRNRYFK